MKTCIGCGEENPERARYCMMCATSLEALTRHERRVVTIVFADMKGSTEIGERLDAEAVRTVLTRFYAASRAVLERHGGKVEKFIGDAVKGVFGVPRAREDDALRAVRAAGELRDAVARMNAELLDKVGVEIQIRTGVNTGEVVAGDTWVDASFVAGDAVNVTARLEQAAPPGEVLLGEPTYRAVRDHVEVEAVEPLTLKGKSEPVPAYRLIRVLDADRRTRSVTPLIGRADELAAILAEVRGGGRLALVVGDPGIGKTRLLEDVAFACETDALVVRTSPDRTGTAGAWPVAPLLAAVAGIDDEDDDERIVDAVTTLLPGRDQAPAIARVAAAVLRGTTGDPPKERWAATQVLAAAPGPVVVVLDDVDAAEDDGLDALTNLLRESPRLTVVAAARPDEGRIERWATSARAPRRVHLGPLDDASMAEIAAHVLGGALPPELAERVLTAAGGNALFLTETLRMLVDEDAIAIGEEGVRLLAPLDALPMPTTIRGVLQGRLDVLDDEQRAGLECAATLGVVCAADALVALIAGDGTPRPVELVAGLVDHGLLVETRTAGGIRIAFHHALLREAAYDAMTKERRARLHEMAGDDAERRGALEDAGSHLETAFGLRTSISLPGESDYALAWRAAGLLARAGSRRLDTGDREGAAALSDRVALLTSVGRPTGEAGVDPVAELAFRLGEWERVIALLEAGDGFEPAQRKWLGVALTKGHHDDAEALAQGRQLIEDAAVAAGDPDAWATLAGTWKGEDDARARTLYARAVELDPADPYALGNVLEYELAEARDLSPIDARRDQLEAAVERRAAQVRRGEDAPWCWYDLAKFRLLLGRPLDACRAYAGGVLTSGASYMVSTNLASLGRLDGLGLEGWDPCERLLRLGLAARFPSEGAAGGTPFEVHGSVVVLAGASSRERESALAGLRGTLIEVLEGREATLISGSTRQGIGAIAGEASAAHEGVRAVGYLPDVLPDDVEVDERYEETRRTGGPTFGPLEPLAYWADILASGVAARDVRVIGASGGELSGLEYRIALALGARVAGITGTGGEIARLLADPRWAAAGRLVEIEPEAATLRRFLFET